MSASLRGLRKVSESLRKRSSTGSSHSSRKSAEERKTDRNMAVVMNGSQVSLPVETKGETTNDPVEVRAMKVNHRDTISSTRTARAVETARNIKRKVVYELKDVDSKHFEKVDLQRYIEYIGDERIVHQPKRGSQWDRVLKEAEFFGLMLADFVSEVSGFVPNSVEVQNTALASCYLLLELGCDQAAALEPTFNTLYELGQLLSHLLQLRDLYVSTESITRGITDLLIQLVALVGDIAVAYRQRINRLSGSSVTIDFNGIFGKQIEIIWEKRQDILNSVWTFKLGTDYSDKDVTSLYQKLEFATTHITARVYNRIAARKTRTEGTCEWFEEDLIDFLDSGDSLLAVTGSAGSGKSMLAAWVRERLERPIGYLQQKYETIGYSFSDDNPGKSTAVSFLQSLLSQLLYIDVGDTSLFHQLTSIVEKSKGHDVPKDLETQLWNSFDSALATLDKRGITLTIIVDSLDETVGGTSKASEIYKHLLKSVQGLATRAMSFSRPISHLGGVGCRHVVLTPEHTRDDIRAFFLENLVKVDLYTKQSEGNKSALFNLLATRAKGSFIFAYLALELLRTAGDFGAYHKSIESMKPEFGGVLDELVTKINFKDVKLNQLFSFAAVADRPLTINELNSLLRVELSTKTLTPNFDVRTLLLQTKGLIVEHNGVVRFKHSVIRSYVISISGKWLMSIGDAHQNFVMTMLFFAKSIFSHPHEPSLERLSGEVVQEALVSHDINAYLLEKWIFHFRQSSLQSPKGDLILTPDFKHIFPDSTFFVLLEWSITQLKFSVVDSIQWHELSLRILIACFGEKHPSVLQSLVVLGYLYRQRNDIPMVAEYSYRAATIGQSILFKFHPLVISCANVFLITTEKITLTKRTTIITYREDMIRYIIEVCKAQYGPQSNAVARWYETLAQLYLGVQEKDNAALVYKELHKLIIEFGSKTGEEKKVARNLAELQVVLQNGESQQDSEQYGKLFLDTEEHIDVTDQLLIITLLRRAKSYAAEGKLLLAERVYVTLWRRISETLRSQHNVQLQVVQLNIALEYVNFLRGLKRGEEACNILVCIWAEYEHTQIEEEDVIIRLKEIGVLLKSFGMMTVSLAILKRVWGWFKERNMIDTETASTTITTITEVVEESVDTVIETTTTTQVTESLVREVFETTYASSKNGKVDQKFFKATSALVSLKIKLKKWDEVESALRTSLELVWKGVFTTDEKLTIEGAFILEKIQAAMQLAICYQQQRVYEKAEQMFININRACLASLDAQDVSVKSTTFQLADFYEKLHRHEKAIGVYTQILDYYRKRLGTSHKFTVEILYKLASTHLLLGQDRAYGYYSEIVAIHTKDGICHHDAFDAARIVFEYHRQRGHWADLKALCTILWETVVQRHQNIVVSEEFMQSLYEQYSYVLETQAKAEFSVLYKLTVEYRETVKKIFSAEAEIIVTAVIALAEVCEKSDKHYEESIHLFEEIIIKGKTITTVTETKIRTVKKRLSKLYVIVVTTGKKTEIQTIERAIRVNVEIYEQLGTELGWWHETTLLKLKELILVYQKLNTEKSRITIVSLLQESVTKIITTLTVTTELYRSATSLATIYATVGLESQGYDLLWQLQLLILFPGFDVDQKTTVKLDAKVGRVALVFLAAFEIELASGAKGGITFSQLMADLLMETLLYEQYTIAISSKSTKFEVVLEHAARLRCLWVIRGRGSFVSVLDKRLFSLFMERYSKHLGQHANNSKAVFDLYEALLFEMGDGAAADRTTPLDFSLVTCKAVNTSVWNFMVKNDLTRAQAVAECGFQFANAHRFYHDSRCGVLGYKLAEMLAGREVPSWSTADSAAKEALLGTSRRVLQTVLVTLREAKVDIVRLQFADLDSLVSLLGEQRNFNELENLLSVLWRSREVLEAQYGWSADTVLQLGSCLVDAHFFAGHLDAAINLCDTMYYNVRASRGALDSRALDFANRLTILLKRAGHIREAARIHVEVVRDLDEHRVEGANGKDNERLCLAADTHIDGMRRSGWVAKVSDGTRVAKALQGRLATKYGKISVPPVEQWNASEEKKGGEITYVGLEEWTLREVEKQAIQRDSVGPAKERWGFGHRFWKTSGVPVAT